MQRLDSPPVRGPLCVALVVSSLAFAALATAAPPPKITVPASTTEQWADALLSTLIEQSIPARPELAQAQADVNAARQRVPQSRALPDPMLQLGVQNDGFTSWEVGEMDTSFYSIMVSQTFVWPRKRRLRGAVADLEAQQVEQTVARVRLSTEAEVRRTYLALILTRDRLALLETLDGLWQRSASIARLRYETGQGAQSDVLRGPLELNRLKLRRWALQAELAMNVQALNRLRDHPLDEPIEPTIHLVDLPLPASREIATLTQDAFARSPELAAARVAVTRSERSVSLARTATLPDLTVNLGVMPRGTNIQPMWLATVSIPLPVFASRKQDRAVAEAVARTTSSRKTAEGLEQALRLRVEQRRTALEFSLESIRLYRDGLLVQSAATAESTLSQYAVGKVPLVAVLDANSGLIADQDGYLQALAQVHLLEIDRLEISLGAVTGPRADMGGGGRSTSTTEPARSTTTASSAGAPSPGSPSDAAPMGSM